MAQPLELRELRIADERPPDPVPRGRSAPVILPSRPPPEDPERNRLIEKKKSFEPLTKVPMWFYDELVTVGFWYNEYKITSVKITKAAFLWISNFICFIAHTSFAAVSIYFSTKDGSTMLTPILTLYTTNLTWVPDSTDALVPHFQKTTGLYLSWMVVSFFLLSAFFHLVIVIFNFNQAFVIKRKRVDPTRNQCCNRSFTYSVHEPARKVTFWTGWYFTRIHDCRNQLRWIEYSFSASLMAMVFAISGGLNHIYIVLMIFGLMFVTMTFGWVSEVYNRPMSRGDDVKPYYWQINDENEHLLTFPDLSARLQRLVPYFLGWVPYLFVWVPLLHSFFWNVQDAPEGAGPPAFVYVIIISQFVLFSLFGICQFIILVRNDGPSFFFWGEWSYVLLSLLAKGVLGSILIVNVLIYSSFDEAVNAAD